MPAVLTVRPAKELAKAVELELQIEKEGEDANGVLPIYVNRETNADE